MGKAHQPFALLCSPIHKRALACRDFVDRGYHQVEVLTLLFALKVAYPERIWLLRGNHESESMNEMYGFKAACLKTFETSAASRAFARAQEVFQWLPLAALVEQPGTKPALVLHGGIGNGEWRIPP